MPDLSERMTRLARDLQSAPDPALTLQEIVNAAMELVEHAETCGITLVRKGKGHRIDTSASYDDVPKRSDLLQMELGEGPCIDAIWEERLVVVRDLDSDERWPNWAPRVVSDLGVRSMMCVRLFTHEDTLGALNMFSSTAHAFDADDRDHAMTVAAHGAVAVAAANRIENLQLAIDNRTVIAQAVGMVMDRYDLTADEGFGVLRRLSSEQNVKVVTIAAEFVADHESAVAERRGSAS